MSIPFIMSNNKITVVVKGKSLTIENGNANFSDLVEAIRDDKTEDEIYDLLQTTQTLEGYVASQGNSRVSVRDEKVYIDGEELHGNLANRIVEFQKNNLPIQHLISFVENIADNPSYNSRQQLYNFLEHKDLVITEDGCFLAYKAVRKDYLDKYSGTIDNTPGQTIRMKRSLIDDNPGSHCSKGLHVGAMQYVKWYGNHNDRVVIVKVNPKNVVSVPNDHDCQKCRVCEYTVLKDSNGVMTQPLYTTTGEPYTHKSYDGGWDFADDDVEDDYDDGEVYSCCDDEYDYGDDEYDYDDEEEDDGLTTIIL